MIDLYQSGNQNKIIGKYGSMARQLFDEHKISEGHYLELMNAAGLRHYRRTYHHVRAVAGNGHDQGSLRRVCGDYRCRARQAP